MDRQLLNENLHGGICVVEFTKLNGDHRSMRCTLAESFLPAKTKNSMTPVEKPNLAVVWDVDAGAWRSFKLDRVISVSPCLDVGPGQQSSAASS